MIESITGIYYNSIKRDKGQFQISIAKTAYYNEQLVLLQQTPFFTKHRILIISF